MASILKIFLIAIFSPLILAGCQTTSNGVSERIGVPCTSHTFDFSVGVNSSYSCFKYSNSFNRTDVERMTYHSNTYAILVDLIKYKNNNFYKTAERDFRNASKYDLEAQVKSGAKDTEIKLVKQFLANMEFKFLDSDNVTNNIVWAAKTSANDITFRGYAFAKLITRGDEKYQFTGYYMKNTDTRMKREVFDVLLEKFRFNDVASSENTNFDILGKRLQKIKNLQEKGLITEIEAWRRQMKVLNSS